MKRLLSWLCASVFSAVILSAADYTPPSYLLDSGNTVISSGVTLWPFDVDSSGQIIGQSSKQVAHGDTIIIAPRVLDPNGVPRQWPTNTHFTMFYQSGAGMAISNLWWLNTSTNYFPVYRSSGIIDTGRVAIVFNATNDYGFATYNCYIAAYGDSGKISQAVRCRLDMLNAPGLNAAIATDPVMFDVFLSNTIYSITSQALTNITTYALRATTNGAPAGYYFIQTPIP